MNFLSSIVTKAYAQSGVSGTLPSSGSGVSFTNPLAYTTFCGLLGAFIKFLMYLAPVIAVLFILFGAFRMLTSGGDPERFEGGKRTILYTIVGFLVVIIAAALVGLIINTFSSAGSSCSYTGS